MKNLTLNYLNLISVFIFVSLIYYIYGFNVTCDYMSKNIVDSHVIINAYSGKKNLEIECSWFKNYDLYIIGQQRIIFDFQINFKHVSFHPENYYVMYLTNFKGFIANNYIVTDVLEQNAYLKLYVIRSDFGFYFNENIIDSTTCFNRSILFLTFSKIDELYIDPSVRLKKTAYCPFVFINSYVTIINIQNLYSVNILNNNFYFMDANKTDIKDSTSKIVSAHFNVLYYKLDKRLLNKIVFQRVTAASFVGSFSSIDKESFRNLISIKMLNFNIYHSSKFVSMPLDWLDPINEKIFIEDDKDSLKKFLQINSSLVKIIKISLADYNLIDEDLCLLKNFPFSRAIFPIVHQYSDSCSCTYIWLSKFFLTYKKYFNVIIANDYYLNYYPGEELFYLQCNISYNDYINCSFEEKFKKCFDYTSLQNQMRNEIYYGEACYSDLQISLTSYEFVTTLFISQIFFYNRHSF